MRLGISVQNSLTTLRFPTQLYSFPRFLCTVSLFEVSVSLMNNDFMELAQYIFRLSVSGGFVPLFGSIRYARNNYAKGQPREGDVFGKEALNVIACENRERLGRTENYKQLQLRHLRAGFVPLPFERELMDSVVKMVRNLYHRDFLITEEKDWLLVGWKGKILYAVSCWQTVSENARVH